MKLMAGNHHSTHPSLLLVSGGQPPIFFSFLIFLLLFSAGCVGQQPQGSPPVNAGGGQANQTSQPYSPQPSVAQPPGQYAGLDFAGLVALEAPLQCNITSIYQGKSFQSQVWMKGGGQIRVESVGGAGLSQCAKTISIVQGSKVYVGCENKTVIPSCDWFVSSYNPLTPGVSSTFYFRNVPADQMTCQDWAYDPSVFTTSGTDCSLGQ